MYWFYQNLTKEAFGRYTLFHCRCTIGNSKVGLKGKGVSWEFIVAPSFHYSLGYNEEQNLTLCISFLFFKLYVALLNVRFNKEPFCIRFYLHENTLWLTYGKGNDFDKDKISLCKTFSFADFLFGEQTRTEKDLKKFRHVFIFPEHSYSADIIHKEITLERPRWFSSKYRVIDIKFDKGVPFPGKGENSWDCGDDAMYSMWAPYKDSHVEAYQAVYNSIRNRRERYGSGYDMYCKV